MAVYFYSPKQPGAPGPLAGPGQLAGKRPPPAASSQAASAVKIPVAQPSPAQVPRTGAAATNPAKSAATPEQTRADADAIHDAVDGGLTGWGTDEDKVFKTLQGKSAADLDRLRAEYRARFGNDNDLDRAILEDLEDPDDRKRAQALLRGNDAPGATTDAAVAQLHQLKQKGDAQGILRVLRETPPEQRAELDQAYQRQYGRGLAQDVESVGTVAYRGQRPLLTPGQMAEAKALIAPSLPGADEAVADAAAGRIHDSLDFGFPGTGWGKGIDTDALKAATAGLTPPQRASIAASYQKRYGASLESDLAKAGDDSDQVAYARSLLADTAGPEAQIRGTALNLRDVADDGDQVHTILERLNAEQVAALKQADPQLEQDLLRAAGDKRWETELLLNRPAPGIPQAQQWQASYDAARLRRALDGGNDEDLVRAVFAGKTGDQVDALAKTYGSVYHEDLRSRLTSELDGRDEEEIVKLDFDRRHEVRAADPDGRMAEEAYRLRHLQEHERGFGTSATDFLQKVTHWDLDYEADNERLQRNLTDADAALTRGDLQEAAQSLGYAKDDYTDLVEAKGTVAEAAATTAGVLASGAAIALTAGTASPLVAGAWIVTAGGMSTGVAYGAINGQAGSKEVLRQAGIGAVSSVPFGGRAIATGGKAVLAGARSEAANGALSGAFAAATDGNTWKDGFTTGLQRTLTGAGTEATFGGLSGGVLGGAGEAVSWLRAGRPVGRNELGNVQGFAPDNVPASGGSGSPAAPTGLRNLEAEGPPQGSASDAGRPDAGPIGDTGGPMTVEAGAGPAAMIPTARNGRPVSGTDPAAGAQSAEAWPPATLQQGGARRAMPEIAPRTEGLGTHATMDDLLESGALPGTEGVTLNGRFDYGKLYRLSTLGGRRIEFALTFENVGGQRVRRLYSGSVSHCPIPPGARPVAHTHPTPHANQRFASPGDMELLNELHYTELAQNPDAAPRPHFVVWGEKSGPHGDYTSVFPGVHKHGYGAPSGSALYDHPAPHAELTGRQAEREALAEVMASWARNGRRTADRFPRTQQTFRSIAGTLDNWVTKNKTRTGYSRAVDKTVLDVPVDHFIRNRPELQSELANIRSLAKENPELGREISDFLGGSAGAGLVGSRQPDLVEFFLDEKTIVVTDFTLNDSRVHRFKTAFYREVIDAMLNPPGARKLIDVCSVDINLRTERHDVRG